MGTGIEWTDETWNPVVGCEHAGSPGCDRCYAARETAGRLQHVPLYAGLAVRPADGGPPRFTGELRTVSSRVDQPLRWRRPRMVFVNSMSDLFHPDVDTPFIARVFAVMALARRHTFQVLTKRPARMARLLEAADFRRYVAEEATSIIGSTSPYDRWRLEVGLDWSPEPDGRGSNLWRPPWPLPNVWLGTSIEMVPYTFRLRYLLEAPAAVRFVSAEPLLAPLAGALRLDGVDWLIVGAESGPGARQCELAWVRDLVDAALAADVAVFVKQLSSGGPRPIKDLADFPADLRIRHYPREAVSA